MKNNKDINYSIDSIKKTANTIIITGWANSINPDNKVFLDIQDINGKKIKYRKERTKRDDVSLARYNEIFGNNFGFNISFSYDKNMIYQFKMFNKNDEVLIVISQRFILFNNVWKKIASFLWQKPISKQNNNKKISYQKWYRLSQPSATELKKQRSFPFSNDAPKFSIVIPLYNTPKIYLRELINSILNQTYTNYEVCFADGSSEDSKLEMFINSCISNNNHFKYHYIGQNLGISGNTNEALKMASGNFVVLCDHDDLLTQDALYEFAQAIINNPECDSVYSDEDKINQNSSKFFEPHFKPDFNIDLLTSVNYICHLFSVRKSLVDKYGGFNSEFDGAQDYDFILRMTEKSRNTIHVPKILYHWRTHQNSTSVNPESKLYAYDAGARAIKAHYQRIWPKLSIEKIETGISLGIYHTFFKLENQPLISIIIPNMDHINDLDKVIRSNLNRGSWNNLEIIVIENNSKEDETFEYYKNIQKEFQQVHVVNYEGTFNYSKINNFGVEHAHGDYYLFMNNDVELIEPDSIKEMIGYAQRKDVGVVGCRLLYEDDTIQHAGVIVGIGGIADHVFRGRLSANDTYFNRAMIVQDYSAVTAAVMLVRREIFESTSGFDENLAVAFNDIDFCLRVRALDKLIVYNPYAAYYHYESKSRGLEDTYEKRLRFISEIKTFLSKWKDFIIKGDPYYNQNLSLITNDYSYRYLSSEKIGEPFYSKQYIDDIISKTPDEIIGEHKNQK